MSDTLFSEESPLDIAFRAGWIAALNAFRRETDPDCDMGARFVAYRLRDKSGVRYREALDAFQRNGEVPVLAVESIMEPDPSQAPDPEHEATKADLERWHAELRRQEDDEEDRRR